jgi:hypothetical protein
MIVPQDAENRTSAQYRMVCCAVIGFVPPSVEVSLRVQGCERQDMDWFLGLPSARGSFCGNELGVSSQTWDGSARGLVNLSMRLGYDVMRSGDNSLFLLRHRRYVHSTLMGEALWPVLPGLASSGECWSWGSRVSANGEFLSVSRCQRKE